MPTPLPLATLLALLLLSTPLPLYAWNSEGHRLVALIAYDQLAQTPEGKTQLHQMATLLREHLPYPKESKEAPPANADDREIFATAATWPDLIKNTRDPAVKPESHKPWHYIDQPLKLNDSIQPPVKTPLPTTPLASTDPNFNNMNILQALAYNRSLWKTATDPRQKAIALAWILHLVGDLHQPLHCVGLYSNHFDTLAGDEGGNLILITDPASPTPPPPAPKPNEELLTPPPPPSRAHSRPAYKPELHAFWDGAFTTDKTPDLNQLETAIVQEFKPADFPPALLAATDETIAQESFTLAQKNVYAPFILKAVQSIDPPQPAPAADNKIPTAIGPVELTPDYQKAALTLARQRIALAGYRLASQLYLNP